MILQGCLDPEAIDDVGLTLIRKSDPARPKRDPKVAVVLAGGAISGGAFKVGGLKALNDFLIGRKITDLDIYVGLSAGSILATSLASGVTPDEMVKVLHGTSSRLDQLRPIDFYQPNLSEFISRPAKLIYDLCTYLPSIGRDFATGLPGLPAAVGPAAREFLREPTYTHLEVLAMRLFEHISPKREVPALTNHVPSGFFDNASLERWLSRSLERLRLPNDFRAFQRKRPGKLYITACDLDTAERVVFGADENSEVTISQAVQASSALPIFYKPARINGVDYVDGGVRHTANIDIAIEKGADLIICYNPFRPFLNRIDSEEGSSRLLRRRPLPLGPRAAGGAEPGLPHAAALPAQARHPALSRGRSLPGRHRVAGAARARGRILCDESARDLEARRRRAARLRIRAHDDRAELRPARVGAGPLRPAARPRGGAPAGRPRAGRPGMGRRRRPPESARRRARAAPGGERPGVGPRSRSGQLPPGW